MTASVRWEVTDAAGVPYQIVVEQVDTREWTDSKPTTFYAAQIGDWPAVGSLRCVMRNERAAVVSVALTAGIEIATVRRCDDEQLADARARVVDTLTSLRAPKSAKILVRHGLLDGAAADPRGAAVCGDLYAGDEPDEGVEVELHGYDPRLPTGDVPADVVESLPGAPRVPRIDHLDRLDVATQVGRSVAHSAWGAGLRTEQLPAFVREDCERALQAYQLDANPAALHIAVAAYELEHARLRRVERERVEAIARVRAAMGRVS